MYDTAISSDVEASGLERGYADRAIITHGQPQTRFITLCGREPIYSHGQCADETYEIIEGAVMLWLARSDGRRKIIQILRSGQSFGHSAGIYRCETAEAIRPTTLRILPAARSGSNEGRTSQLLKEALERIDWLQRHSMALGRMTALERVAAFLLEQPSIDDRPLPHAGKATIRLDVTREEMGDHLGLTIETVSRCLGKLKRSGLISIRHLNAITIHNLSGLGAVADGRLLKAS